MDVLRKIFAKEKAKFAENKDFNAWLQNNSHWLPGYALFSTLRDKHKTSDYSLWPELSHPSQEQLTTLTGPKSPYYESVLFYFYLQYQLHLQLQDAANYAASHKVGIKGDIAIGVSPKGVETWIAPHLFRLDKSTGAPPDAFCKKNKFSLRYLLF
jgi:4-alpha-glucanotransferase